jgi:prepilin signal peptidase PulO-like enzyme (type II secretory pathway)
MNIPELIPFALSFSVLFIATSMSLWIVRHAEILPDEGSILKFIALNPVRCFDWRIVKYSALVASACFVPAGLLIQYFHLPYIALCLLAVFGIMASVFDARLQVIPEELTWVIFFTGILFSPWNNGYESAIYAAIVCGGLLWAMMAAKELISNINTRAGADIALIMAGGVWSGLAMSGVYVFIACLLWFVYNFVTTDEINDDFVPFGPALILAIPITPVFNGILLEWFKLAL